MTRDETKLILAVLRSAFPNFYRGMGGEELSAIVNLWTEMFRDEPMNLVAAAVKAMIAARTNTFPPNIGEVKEQIAKIKSPHALSPNDAWGMVVAATRNSLYNSQKEFERLPPNVQRVVGSPMQLKEWAMMESDTFASVVASNFQRAFRVRAERDREFDKMPSDVKVFIEEMAGKMSLGDGSEPPNHAAQKMLTDAIKEDYDERP